MKLLIGGDPEVFLKDTKKDMFISAYGLIPGTKKEPHKVKSGAIQVDGTALEINIDPASTAEEFDDNIETVLNEARGFLPENIELEFKPVVHYEAKYFKTLNPVSLELGCNPDYRATDGQRNGMPRPSGTMRTAAGHISLGWGNGLDVMDAQHFWDCRQMCTRLDKYFSHYKYLFDNDNERYNMYGRFGAFRPKPFGVEFRALSNAWVAHRSLRRWVFDSAKWVFDHAVNGGTINPYNTPRNLDHIGYDRNYTPIFSIPKVSSCNEVTASYFNKKDFPKFPSDVIPPPVPELFYDRNGRDI